jgi:hypothetical protein
VPHKTPKPLEQRVDALEERMKEHMELTNNSSEDIRDLKGAQRRLEKRLAKLEKRPSQDE